MAGVVKMLSKPSFLFAVSRVGDTECPFMAVGAGGNGASVAVAEAKSKLSSKADSNVN